MYLDRLFAEEGPFDTAEECVDHPAVHFLQHGSAETTEEARTRDRERVVDRRSLAFFSKFGNGMSSYRFSCQRVSSEGSQADPLWGAPAR